MAITFIQQSLTFTTGSATISAGADGNTLILVIATNNVVPATVVSLACTHVTWVKLSSTTSGRLSNEIWKGQISGGASGTTVTITLSSIGAVIAGSVSEFSGVLATGVVQDSGPNTNNGNSMTAETGAFVTTVDGDLIVASTAYADSLAPGAQPGGYSALTFDSNITIGTQANYSTSNSGGAQASVQWGSLPSSQPWIANVAAVRADYDPVVNFSTGAGVVGVEFSWLPANPFVTNGSLVVGGCGPITLTVISGSLPPGMSATSIATSPTGQVENDRDFIRITGTPTTPGTYPFTLSCTDSANNTCTWATSITIVALQQAIASGPGMIAPDALPGSAYTFTFDDDFASSIVPSFIGPFMYGPFVLEPFPGYWAGFGLAISSGGVLSATPMKSQSGRGIVQGVMAFTVQGTNSGTSLPESATGKCFFTFLTIPPYIESNPPSIDTTTYVNQFDCPGSDLVLPDGVIGVPYSYTLPAAGGIPPYNGGDFPPPFILTGSLPAGLSFNATTGVISGTPTHAGTSSLIPSLTDSVNGQSTINGSSAIISLSGRLHITITSGGGSLTIRCNNPPSGTIGTPYTHTFLISGGTPPYNVTIIAGALPTGVTITDATTGTISGTPITMGTFSFTVQVEDAGAHIVSVVCSILIKDQIHYRNAGASGRGFKCVTGQMPMCLPPNEFDACLKDRGAAFRQYTQCGLMWRKMFPKYAGMKSPPWVTSPFDATRLNQNAKVVFSALTPGVLTPVLTYTVPSGYAGVVNQTLQIFAPTTGGTKFQDGSSQLAWFIGVNQCFMAPGFNDMKYHQGSLSLFGRVAYGAGIRLFPNQIWTYYVVSDGTPLDPDGNVICGFNGWLYPLHG